MPSIFGYTLNPPAVAPPTGESVLGFSALAYARMLKDLFPPGAAFLLLPDSWLSKLLHAIATELARIDQRGRDLLEEGDPRTTTELLTDWERALGLPDGCVLELPATTAERRNAVVTKLIARGGQSAAFYISIAAAMGVTATVSEYASRVLRVGFRVGDRVWDIGEAFHWSLDSTGAIASGLLLPTPVISSVVRLVELGGFGAGTYSYRVAAKNAAGSTLASAAVAQTTLLANSKMRITWGAVTEATSYDVFGRTAGSELFLANVLAPLVTYDDAGGAAAGALPSTNDARTLKAESLECIVTRAKPAHTTVDFSYTP